MRLFVAIDPGDDIRKELRGFQEELQKGIKLRMRYTPEENLHLTVKFLGEVQDEKIPGVLEILKSAALDTGPVKLKLEGVGVFPEKHGPVRIVWAGLNDDDGYLKKIASELDPAFEWAGVAAEGRPFVPHITIARVAKDEHDTDFLRRYIERARLPEVSCRIEELLLFSSLLDSGGSRYSIVEKIAL